MNDPRRVRYVTWDRWEEAHARLGDQIADLRRDFEELREQHAADIKAIRNGQQRRKDRMWTLTLAVLTAFLLPLLILAIQSLGGK